MSKERKILNRIVSGITIFFGIFSIWNSLTYVPYGGERKLSGLVVAIPILLVGIFQLATEWMTRQMIWRTVGAVFGTIGGVLVFVALNGGNINNCLMVGIPLIIAAVYLFKKQEVQARESQEPNVVPEAGTQPAAQGGALSSLFSLAKTMTGDKPLFEKIKNVVNQAADKPVQSTQVQPVSGQSAPVSDLSSVSDEDLELLVEEYRRRKNDRGEKAAEPAPVSVRII